MSDLTIEMSVALTTMDMADGEARVVPRALAERSPTWKNVLQDLDDSESQLIPNVEPELDRWCLERALEHCEHYQGNEELRDAEDIYTCDAWETEWINHWPAAGVEPLNMNRRLLAMDKVADYLDLTNLKVACRTVMRERLDDFYERFEREHPENPENITGDPLEAYQEDWIVDRLDALYNFCGTEDEKVSGPFAYRREQKKELLAMYRKEQENWD